MLCQYGFHKYFCFKAMHILSCRKHIIRIFAVPYQISSRTYKDKSATIEIYTFKNILGQILMGIQCTGLYVKM